jgi:hypothetical protein
MRDAHPSFSQFEDHVKLPILDHGFSLLRGESAIKVGNFQPVILGILSPFSTLEAASHSQSTYLSFLNELLDAEIQERQRRNVEVRMIT